MVFPKKTIEKIYSTEEILKDLNNCIIKKKPFSTTRLGDAGHGILASFICPDLIEVGKWSGAKGKRGSNNILGQLTVPTPHRNRIVRRVIKACDQANYTDCYEAFYDLDTTKGVGILGRKWKEIHECCGITNENYCSSFVHYFSIVDGEYNLFDIMKNRRIFCITSMVQPLEKLKLVSGAAVIDHYKIPRRGRSAAHYRKHFKQVCKLINQRAKNYDLFIIGAGFLGKIYCGLVKEKGGRAFDAGRLFDFWAGTRRIDSRPKRFITYSGKKMLCIRKRKPRSNLW